MLLRTLPIWIIILCTISCSKEKKDGLLWKISGNGLEKPSYLFGTVHGDQYYTGDLFLKNVPDLYKSLEKTEQFIGEKDHYSQMSPENYQLPSDSSYEDLLNREDLALLDSVLQKEYNKTSKEFPFRPEVLSRWFRDSRMREVQKKLLFEELNTKKRPEKVVKEEIDAFTYKSMDDCLQETAHNIGHKTVGLDDLIEFDLYKIMGNKPLKEKVANLISSIRKDSTDDWVMKSLNDTLALGLKEAYYNQDINGVERYSLLLREQFCKNNADGERIDNELCYIRNHKWMEHIPGLIKDAPSFIAVGCRHLPEENGLINLLRKKGYTVEPVN